MSSGAETFRESLPVTTRCDEPGPSLDARSTTFGAAHLKALRPPAGAPNVLIVLLDDMGFGGPSAFGGPCEMPTAERLADAGLRYSRFHVNALCSPTRQSLLTGRNHHAVGMGCTTETATAAPGYTAVRPRSAATIAQILRGNGYSTAAFGKMHQTPQWEVSASGPFDRWPTGEGFEKFYGFVGPEMNHWDPLLFDGTTPVEPKALAGGDYHLSEDLADKAIEWIQLQNTLTPDKPFFAYLSMAACHAPLHVAPEWKEKYKGQFDGGWDAMRAATLERQKALGVVPKDAVLAPWIDGVPHWDELSEVQKAVGAAFMETYAAVAEHVDAQVGRVVDALDEMAILDDTLVIYLLGDNGASSEGGLEGTFNVERAYSGILDTSEEMYAKLDELGGPSTYPLQPTGWTLAMNTPYKWAKQVASHFGATRDGLIVHWPAYIQNPGSIRHQWHHVVDILPTILEAAGIPAPRTVDGVDQQRIDGVSMYDTFNNAEAPERHTTQYFETLGNRGIYHDNWMAVTKHRTPWEQVETELPAFDDDVWELYCLETDWTQAIDLAREHPEKLSELKQLFVVEAARNSVFPIDDRVSERYNPEIAGRPDLMFGRRSMTLGGNMTRLSEETVPNVKNRSHRITVQLDVGDGDAHGVLVAQGGRFGGWTLFCDRGTPVYVYNYFGLEEYRLEGVGRLGPGSHEIEFVFTYDGGGFGLGGDATLSIDGGTPAATRIPRTTPFLFSSHETLDVGVDLGTAVATAYESQDCRFNQKIESVTIDLGQGDVVADQSRERLLAHQ